jgi:diaminopimelate epimerase
MNAISKINKNDRGHFVLNTGSPHYIIFDSIQDDKLIEKARAIRYSDEFPEGINVNWATKIGEKELFVRTYERGVEDETYSCGTGVTAAALAYAHEYKIEHDVINIKTKGGDFLIRFGAENDHFKNVKLKGAATFVFEGEITI